LVANVPSLSVGTHAASVSNALGIATSTRSLVAVSATPYNYATVATGGRIDALAIDDERGILYGLHHHSEFSQTDGYVRRFRAVGSSWVADANQAPGAAGVGVQYDGDLVVTRAPGTLTVVDQNTFAEKFSFDLICNAGSGENGFPVTLDGRV